MLRDNSETLHCRFPVTENWNLGFGSITRVWTATGPGDASPAASTTTGGSSSPTGSGCMEFRPEGGPAAPHAAPAVFPRIAAGHSNFGDLDDGSADAEGRDLE